MLNRQRIAGVSLIELLVAVSILGFMLALTVPNFGPWMAGTRIRSTAESMLAGLQYAKSEATTRNTQVRFQLTTSVDATCARSNSGASWVVDVVDADPATDSVESRCNSTAGESTAPSILKLRSASETGGSVVVTSDASQVIFNGFGRQAAVAPATTTDTVTIDITPPGTVGKCAAAGGKVTCLRVLVSPAGQVRMCNPSVAAGDPQAC